MKKTLLTIAIAITSYYSYAQTYLPLTGGTLTGTLAINGAPFVLTTTGGNTMAAGSSATVLGSGSGTDHMNYVYGNNPFSIWTNNQNRLTIDGSGNVGISTTSPRSPLDINGAVSITNETGLPSSGVGVELSYQTSTGNGRLISYDRTNSVYKLFNINDNIYVRGAGGNVGIGTTSPSYKLDVNGGFHTAGTSELGSGYLHVSTDQSFSTAANYTFRDGVGINNPNGSSFATGSSVMSIGAMSNGISLITTGNIGVGTIDTKSYMLAVNGSAIATSMTVKLYADWPDYVFKKNYHLPSLTMVKAYIDKNQHLPDMPSEQEVKDNGINLGEIVKVQTKKIEELTLYAIEQQKRIDQLEKQQTKSEQQEARIAALEKALSKLTANNASR